MMVVKRHGGKNPRKSRALLASPIYIGQAQGEGIKHIKRGAKGRGVGLSPVCNCTLCLSFSLSSLHIFWVGMPPCLEDVFSFVF